VDRELEQAANVDGASPWQIFTQITIPLCWPILLGGLVMAWARALGEFGATIIFAGNFPGRTQTMPLAIYIGFEIELDLAITLALILLGTSFLVLLIVKFLLRQRTTQ
jgi:molybdate transport system permease protein